MPILRKCEAPSAIYEMSSNTAPKDAISSSVDGHTTHCKNLEALRLTRENEDILIQLPGHTTHRLQSLDRSFFKPMEVYYCQAAEKWLRSNPGRVITQYHVAGLINEAYSRAAAVENAVNGFKGAGV
ncbi:hypothetical protein NQ318_023636 [Aromia moschata]|uniref:DDE-1 domain-containing protein n=1 Tax=Aromia moschata TaxID=1265417 RepID=A0AAV8YR81_9CUCU|nr:hypothetical protein NQ318_023636 [Aromia moschata]